MPDGNNLTIDFSDVIFDNDIVEPNISNVDLDVVFPLDDSPTVIGSGAHEKTGLDYNRVSQVPAASIALMPTDAQSDVMEEFSFEFDNDVNEYEIKVLKYQQVVLSLATKLQRV